jgi:hypothetical protein
MKKRIHLLLLLIAGISLAGATGLQAQSKTIKAGATTTVSKELPSFQSIEVSSAFNVNLSHGKQQAISIEAPENFIPYYQIEVRNNVLHIELNKSANNVSLNGDMGTISVSCSDLKSIQLSGASELHGSGSFSSDKFMLDLSGASKLVMDLETKELHCDISGASKATLNGAVKGSMKLDVSGAACFRGYDLEATNAVCDMSGAGKAELKVNSKLQVDASGASSVSYTGNASEILVDASGAASVARKK